MTPNWSKESLLSQSNRLFESTIGEILRIEGAFSHSRDQIAGTELLHGRIVTSSTSSYRIRSDMRNANGSLSESKMAHFLGVDGIYLCCTGDILYFGPHRR